LYKPCLLNFPCMFWHKFGMEVPHYFPLHGIALSHSEIQRCKLTFGSKN
jgi:hypothetical protein